MAGSIFVRINTSLPWSAADRVMNKCMFGGNSQLITKTAEGGF